MPAIAIVLVLVVVLVLGRREMLLEDENAVNVARLACLRGDGLGRMARGPLYVKKAGAGIVE